MARKIKSTTGYRIPPDIERKVISLIDSGEFNTKADVFTAALRFYFENKDDNLKNELKAFLDSNEGIEYLEKIVDRIEEKRKNRLV